MSGRKIQLFVLGTLGWSMLGLWMLLAVQATQAAPCANGVMPARMSCPGGGGGGCGGGGAGGGSGGGQLTQDEIDGLTYMREEEKLARDSYWTLYARWGLPIFSKIANSEVMHMSKMKELLDFYGQPDPAAGKAVGEFTNPILQQLYNDLIVQGNQSSREALKVGVAIEEVDIRDLQHYLGLTNKSAIISAYNMLLNGSYCHLRAFNSQLGQ
jgi:hypothetical protein